MKTPAGGADARLDRQKSQALRWTLGVVLAIVVAIGLVGVGFVRGWLEPPVSLESYMQLPSSWATLVVVTRHTLRVMARRCCWRTIPTAPSGMWRAGSAHGPSTSRPEIPAGLLCCA